MQSLKFISNQIAPNLSLLINRCFSYSKFPDSFKTARVIPVYKSDEKECADNYRLISIFPVISKIYKK